jgi:tryptophan synthase alpha chain
MAVSRCDPVARDDDQALPVQLKQDARYFMSRISKVFETLRSQRRKALIPFITAGDPRPQTTVPLMHALVKGGADIIELGVPFSDPMADGPVIQRSSERALAQGVTLRNVLDFVAEFRRTDATTPVVLMGYANPIESMGLDRFADAATGAGADGVLVVDYPPEEAETLVKTLDSRGLQTIFLLSPTTVDERLKQVAELGRGYLYYVSLRGVTGAANIDIDDVASRIARIKSFTTLPVGVGFGIRDGATAANVARVADAVVIGSRLVQEIDEAGPEAAPERIAAIIREIRTAMDAATQQ